MNISAVNELIATLESAGELSIKETKVMALAKAYQKLAAENVALKAGRKFFMYSDDAGFETYQTREEAIKAAEEMIDDYRGDAGDGWPEEAGTTRWGVIIQQATECDYEKPSAENGWLGWCDYRLLPETPATDRIVAGIKADGVEQFAESQKEYVSQHRNEMDQILRAAYAGSAVDAERFAKQLREDAK
ncbi:hypothetical protein [Klebsiella pneumoniae]|uniref:hypothetical protein n=1 Tax=Klebsiella pneumoniae TaxID=573 RepID=UPI001B8BD854|nr:hypothetical protein [Klebsiella pneumoniae]MBR7307433.1 hypothetical protein [Klebsiella pneumoniae]MBR7345031.1 hypothetical protein [Klebsiella pneumoniae]